MKEFADAMARACIAKARHKRGDIGSDEATAARDAAVAVFERLPPVEKMRAKVLPLWGLVPLYASFAVLEEFRKYAIEDVDGVFR